MPPSRRELGAPATDAAPGPSLGDRISDALATVNAALDGSGWTPELADAERELETVWADVEALPVLSAEWADMRSRLHGLVMSTRLDRMNRFGVEIGLRARAHAERNPDSLFTTLLRADELQAIRHDALADSEQRLKELERDSVKHKAHREKMDRVANYNGPDVFSSSWSEISIWKAARAKACRPKPRERRPGTPRVRGSKREGTRGATGSGDRAGPGEPSDSDPDDEPHPLNVRGHSGRGRRR